MSGALTAGIQLAQSGKPLTWQSALGVVGSAYMGAAFGALGGLAGAGVGVLLGKAATALASSLAGGATGGSIRTALTTAAQRVTQRISQSLLPTRPSPSTGPIGEAAENGGGSIAWPPNNGFHGRPGVTVLKPGAQIDRFGLDGGTFASPVGTSFAERALPSSAAEAPYNVFEVIKRLVVQHGPAEPWFGQPGMGTQFRLPASIEDLIGAGYIRKVN